MGRNILVLIIVNTIIFVAALKAGLSTLTALGITAAAVVAILFALSWFSKVQQLTNQATKMYWVPTGFRTDAEGYRDTILEKNGVSARISWQQKCVFVEHPLAAGPFQDFIEVDRYLVEQGLA